MRILLVNTLYPTPLHPKTVGGAERSVRNLAEALVAEGCVVQVVRALPPRADRTDEKVNGVRVFGVPISNLYWPFDGQDHRVFSRLLWHFIDDWSPLSEDIQGIIRSFRPQIVHTNNLVGIGAGIWRAAVLNDAEVVHTLRDYYLMCARSNLFRGADPCRKKCAECVLTTAKRRMRSQQAMAVVGNSKATLSLHIEDGLFKRSWLKTAIGSLADRGATLLPPRSRTPGAVTTFGFIGRVTAEKGIFLLAQAHGSFQGRSKLVVAGETDPSVQERLNAAAGGQQIEYMGFVEPRKFYEAIDVAVVPSLWHEPLPRAAIDAVSYGRPIIGSARGGIPESMGEPPFGWIFDPEEISGLRRAMEAAMEQIDNGSVLVPSQVEEGASPLQKYLSLYERALSPDRASALWNNNDS